MNSIDSKCIGNIEWTRMVSNRVRLSDLSNLSNLSILANLLDLSDLSNLKRNRPGKFFVAACDVQSFQGEQRPVMGMSEQ